MGKRFWDEAEKAAGEAYGKANAATYARREKLKRAAGGILAGALVLFVVVRTYAEQILAYAYTGALYAGLFVGGCTFVFLAVRTYKLRVRTRRTYTGARYVRTLPASRTYEDDVRTREFVRTRLDDLL